MIATKYPVEMRKSIPFARVGVIMPVVNFLNKIGTNLDSHLQKANIPLDILENSEKAVPLPMLVNFMTKTAETEGIKNLGIAMARETKIIDLGKFGSLISQSINTYQLLKRICYLTKYAINPDGEKFWLQEEEKYLWLCQSFTKPIHKLSGIDNSYYYTLALLIDSLRLVLGEDWQPLKIYLPTQPDEEIKSTLNLDKTSLYYQQSYTAICIPKKYLTVSRNDLKKTIYNPQNIDSTEWQNDFPNLDLINATEETIKILLLEQYPTINITAEVCGLKVRSLQRYLSEQNLTYFQLVDKVRYELALELINNQDISLTEISYSLGFKNPANFSHTFRRWTGISPSSFRKYVDSQKEEGIKTTSQNNLRN